MQHGIFQFIESSRKTHHQGEIQGHPLEMEARINFHASPFACLGDGAEAV